MKLSFTACMRVLRDSTTASAKEARPHKPLLDFQLTLSLRRCLRSARTCLP